MENIALYNRHFRNIDGAQISLIFSSFSVYESNILIKVTVLYAGRI